MNRAGLEAQRDRLYRNRCDGTFEPVAVSTSALRSGFVVLGAHLDGDLWPDLYVANVSFDLAWPHHWDQIYRNRGGVLEELPPEAIPGVGDDAQAAMGIDVADVNLDGRWDLYISDLLDGTPHESPPWGNVLYLGGEGALLHDNVAVAAGVAGDDSWGVNFLDADHDGWEDLYVATMMGAASELLFANNRDGTFTNVAASAGYLTGHSRGSAVADYDADGDLDIAVINQHVCGNTRPTCSLQLLRNDTPAAGGWLQLRLTGTRSNRDAIGAVVRVRAGDLTMMRQIKGGSGGHSPEHPDRPLRPGAGEDGRRGRDRLALRPAHPLAPPGSEPADRSDRGPGVPLRRPRRLQRGGCRQVDTVGGDWVHTRGLTHPRPLFRFARNSRHTTSADKREGATARGGQDSACTNTRVAGTRGALCDSVALQQS